MHLSSWGLSGLSAKAYCAEHSIKLATFYYWRKKLVNQPKSGFTTFERPATGEAYLLHYPNGMVLEVPSSLSFSDLAALLKLGSDV